jgi:threonine/homoserine/homoserine lactone efflux protein
MAEGGARTIPRALPRQIEILDSLNALISILLGTLVGLLFAIPLGPISLFVAQQTMRGQTRNGLRVATGSVVIDIIYCLVITLGFISLIAQYLQNHYVQLALAVVMILYGLKMLLYDRRHHKDTADPLVASKATRNGNNNLKYLLGTTMALANPTLFLSWTAALSFLSAQGLLSHAFWDKIIFSLSAGFGNLIWFVGLALFVRSKRHVISARFIDRTGIATALVVLGFGVYFSVTILRTW